MDHPDMQVTGMPPSTLPASDCPESALDFTALYGTPIIGREQADSRSVNAPNYAAIPYCLSLHNNVPATVMGTYHRSGSFGSSVESTNQLDSLAVASSGQVRTGGGVNNIAPLATPLFQLPASAINNNSSHKPLQKPRFPMSSYAYFIQERREMYRRIGASIKFTEFSKKCSEVWGKMPIKEKEKFKVLASLDKVRYQKEMDFYKKATAVKVEKRGRKKRQPGHPKRNMSAFLFFSAEKRPLLKSKNPKATVGNISKQLSDKWKQMTDEEKEPYIKMADCDKKRYDLEKISFSAGLQAGYHARLEEDNLLFGRSEGTSKKKDPSMPKRNMSAFMFFSIAKRPELRKSNPGVTLSVLSKMLSEAWKRLMPFQKTTYETMASNDKERYHQQIASYRCGKQATKRKTTG